MQLRSGNVTAPTANTMQLRSGKIVNNLDDLTPRHTTTTTQCPDDYVPNPVEIAKFKVREQVKERQRQKAEVHIKKFIDNTFIPTVHMLMADVNNTPNNEDPTMHRIRGVTYLFGYLNSQPSHIIMSPKLMRFLSTALKQCEQFRKDAEAQIQFRISAALEVLPGLQADDPSQKRTPESIRTYYMTYLENMLAETEHFKATYGNRL